MTKYEVRPLIRQRRGELTSACIADYSQAVVGGLVQLLRLVRARSVLLYIPLPKEVQPLQILSSFAADYFAPRMRGESLDIVPYDSSTALCCADFNVLEPVGEAMPESFVPDVILVPGVAFDRLGNRVGYGKGYYDRLLTRCSSSVFIGICFDFQLFDSIEGVEQHDVRMHHVVTNSEVLGF